MALPAGTRLGPYEIMLPLGAGGMGEVYRAHDTRLDRDVAIKVMHLDFWREPEARQRFVREAHLVSRLSHPHICGVHDIGEHDGAPFLVMECLEGDTLAARLTRGNLSIPEALKVGIEIALALDAAHRAGIVHRDLKPANVMLTRAGAKLLDFGIATASTGPMSNVAVTTEQITRPGALLGTPNYMAPEQVRGEAADHRTDIFALGLLLFEIIAHRRAFDEKSHAEIVAAVLTRKLPSPSALEPSSPAELDHVVERCLSKDPEERWQSALDVANLLRRVADRGSVTVSRPANETGTMRRLLPMMVGVVVLVGSVIYGISGGAWQPQATDPLTIRASVPLPPNAQLAAARPSIAISNDGRFLAFVASLDGVSRLHVRPVDAFETTAVKGTDAASGPFFSPDGQWIGFSANGRLMKVPREGGTAVVICEATDVRGASWGIDGTIVFSPRLDAGLYRVSADGGVPVEVTVPSLERREKTHRFPELLPDGKTVMFTVGNHDIATFDEATIALQLLTGGAPKTIITGGAAARYLPSGHIVYARSDALIAVPFDVDRLEVTGPAVTVAEGVAFANDYGRVEYDVSDTGTLVYLPGGDTSQRSMLVSVSRDGAFTPLTSQPRLFLSVEYSPANQSLFTIIGGANDTGWIYDTIRDVPTRLTFRGNLTSASWTPDGRRILYSQAGELGSIAADGSGDEEVLYRDDTQKGSPAMTADGAALLFQTIQAGKGFDIWTLATKSRQATPWLSTRFDEWRPRLSSDGRWVAYVSNESGRAEVYVRELANPGVKRQVSRDGGALPTWSRDGRELFFLKGAVLMSAAIRTEGLAFTVDRPTPLFTLRRLPNDDGAIYDVGPDGRHFVVVEPVTTHVPTIANLVTGWSIEIDRRVRTR